MIGHYLLTLTQDEGDRVLTSRLAPGSTAHPGEGTYLQPDGSRCLVGAVRNVVECDNGKAYRFGHDDRGLMSWSRPGDRINVERRYDALCKRFGTSRVNAAIRARIIENRARRALSRVTPLESCVA